MGHGDKRRDQSCRNNLRTKKQQNWKKKPPRTQLRTKRLSAWLRKLRGDPEKLSNVTTATIKSFRNKGALEPITANRQRMVRAASIGNSATDGFSRFHARCKRPRLPILSAPVQNRATLAGLGRHRCCHSGTDNGQPHPANQNSLRSYLFNNQPWMVRCLVVSWELAATQGCRSSACYARKT